MSAATGPGDDLQRAHAVASERVQALIASMSADLQQREDSMPTTLARMTTPTRAKLGKLYQLLNEMSAAAAPYVACRKGCSSCCHMNVSITDEEAQRLAKASGRKPARLTEPHLHVLDAFIGQPCPFLVNNRCSVYEDRPYACRAHFSFDTTAYWCEPTRALDANVGMIEFGGAKHAYQVLAGATALGGFADIRDFFPASPRRA